MLNDTEIEASAPSLDPSCPVAISKPETHRHLPIGATELNNKISSGKIATIRVGTHRLVLWASLERFITEACAEAIML